MKPRLSVVVPSYLPDPVLLRKLYDSLQAQDFTDFELLIVDDGSPDLSAYDFPEDARARLIRQEKNAGPAAARNRGAAEARSDHLFFTDTDCELAGGTLAAASAALQKDDIFSGNTRTAVKTRIGRAIALLGFPGGGILGFDRVWRVDKDGYTRSFSSCNLAVTRERFFALGGFDESFPLPGGEDTVLAAQACAAGFRIRYVPEMLVYHVEKSTLGSFFRWQLIRGRGNWHIKKRLPSVGGYLRLRVWTFSNSLKAAGILYAVPVLLLIVISVVLQVTGMIIEKRRMKKDGSP
ncbi:MAG TPA: glycosyltransferase [Candidatus Hydrogenedentes bacterium]|nr:glycosyltransferase [Candidatus Hydrogenedentota bacterium]